MADLKHAAARKSFEVAFNGVYKYINKNKEQNLVKLMNAARKIAGKNFPDSFWDTANEVLGDTSCKWTQQIYDAFDNLHPNLVKTHVLNLGFEAGLTGFKKVKENREKYNCNVPWLILMDPTSACNLKCTGCWAAEYGHNMSLTNEEIDRVICEAKELGIHFFIMTGGEPMVRKKDILMLAEKHSDCAFHIFTNGTLIDEEVCKKVQKLGNISFALSIEGDEDVNDSRRGQGVYGKVMHAMDLMKEHGLIYGTSICYTSKNYKAVTSDEFLQMLVDKGAIMSWFFHYMPVGKDASTDLLLTPEQREYMVKRVRYIRSRNCPIKLYTMDFQNDAEFVGGCIAGGKNYCHINANGDVEPCVFIHYSGANIREKSFLECLQQPLFMQYHDTMPFNENMFQPCPMLENPECIERMVKASGAHSTDMQAEEAVEDLVAKTKPYAASWAPTAERLWNEEKEEKEKKAAADAQ
ncbi:MAG: radical SAM protein [Lachnospiraceae bacterium]|nr:radical SAM protein [Lachnospiraceae bacterium]